MERDDNRLARALVARPFHDPHELLKKDNQMTEMALVLRDQDELTLLSLSLMFYYGDF
jgi:hypothetical protein